MPELPEVETVLRTLEHQIRDLQILAVDILYPKMIKSDLTQFKTKLINQHFRRFERRGKYLIFRMDDVTLVSHLRMEGKYYIQTNDEPIPAHTHVIFHLSNNMQLRYNDTRKFGTMELVDKDYDFTHFRDLGPEPFSSAFHADYVHSYRKKHQTPIKTLLLDQSFVAGIGNIYADEILAACQIRPTIRCNRLKKSDDIHIVEETKRILKEAIALGGTTIRSYTSSLGVTGRFQTNCSVHMQKICQKCQGEIKIKRIGGRSSYYCPHCQKGR